MMTPNADLTVCVIGHGSVGSGMANSLLDDQFEVTHLDVRTNSMAQYAEIGGRVASALAASAKDAYGANARQPAQVMFEPRSAAAQTAKYGITVSCRTMSPDACRHFVEQVAAVGVGYIDAPFSGAALTMIRSDAPTACVATTIAKAMIPDNSRVYEVVPASSGNSRIFANDIRHGIRLPTPMVSMALQIFVVPDPAGRAN